MTDLMTDLMTDSTALTPRPPLDAPVTLAALGEDPVTLWLQNHQRLSTRRAYARALKDFARYLAEQRGKPGLSGLLAVTFADTLHYREALLDRQPPLRGSSIRAQLKALSSLAAHFLALGLTTTNPWARVELPPVSDRKPQRAWRLDELLAFMQAIPNPARAATPYQALQASRDAALFWLLFRNGLRIEEVCGARLGDLERVEDLSALRLREHGRADQHIKRGVERVTVLKPETFATLTAYLERRGVIAGGGETTITVDGWAERPLFADAKRRRADVAAGVEPALSSRQVRRLMVRYGTQAGLEASLLHPHAARRTAITTLAWRETSIAALQAFSGHKSIAAVQVYIDLAQLRDSPALRMPY